MLIGIVVNPPTSVVEFAAPRVTPRFEIDDISVSYYRYGLLVPLLPNWPRPFVKFSGANGRWLEWDESIAADISEREYDSLSLLLAALCHFIWVRSGGQMVIADVQGDSLFIQSV